MTLFESGATQEILLRLNRLQSSAKPLWGKMSAAQMMAHCIVPIQTFFGEIKAKRGLAGILFGRMAKKKLVADKPWPQNLPTTPQFLIQDEKEFEREKEKLISYINRFATDGYTIISSTHPFFGKLSSQEWAVLGYKHLDHHLRQFGV